MGYPVRAVFVRLGDVLGSVTGVWLSRDSGLGGSEGAKGVSMRQRSVMSVLFLLAGCGTPAALPREIPRGEARVCFARDPLPANPGPVDVVQIAYPRLSKGRAGDLIRLVRLALPEGAWSGLTGLEYYGDQFSVAQSPRLRERVQSLLWAIQRRGRRAVATTVGIYEVPWETVGSLGPLAQARGAGSASPLLAVPVSREGFEQLEALASNGPVRVLWRSQVSGLAAQWCRLSSENKRAYVAGLDLRSDRHVGVIADADVATVRDGTVAEVACLAVNDGLLLAFDVWDTLVTWTDPLDATHGLHTRVSASLPTKTVRRANDVAFVRPGEFVALVGASEREGVARLILLGPELLPNTLLPGDDDRDLQSGEPDLGKPWFGFAGEEEGVDR
jgi:hypothetical protein